MARERMAGKQEGKTVGGQGGGPVLENAKRFWHIPLFSKQSEAIAEEALIFQKTDGRKADGGREMTLTDEKTERKK